MKIYCEVICDGNCDTCNIICSTKPTNSSKKDKDTDTQK